MPHAGTSLYSCPGGPGLVALMAPFWQSYRGIERYWTKKHEAEAATAP